MKKVATGLETDWEEADQKEVDSPVSKCSIYGRNYSCSHSGDRVVVKNSLGVWGEYYVNLEDSSTTLGAPTISMDISSGRTSSVQIFQIMK